MRRVSLTSEVRALTPSSSRRDPSQAGLPDGRVGRRPLNRQSHIRAFGTSMASSDPASRHLAPRGADACGRAIIPIPWLRPAAALRAWWLIGPMLSGRLWLPVANTHNPNFPGLARTGLSHRHSPDGEKSPAWAIRAAYREVSHISRFGLALSTALPRRHPTPCCSFIIYAGHASAPERRSPVLGGPPALWRARRRRET